MTQRFYVEPDTQGSFCITSAPWPGYGVVRSQRETAYLLASAPLLLDVLKSCREFVEAEVEQRGCAGSDMSGYQDEAERLLCEIDAAILSATVAQ